MKKVKNRKFFYRVYGDYDLDCSLSPYEKKYNYTVAFPVNGEITVLSTRRDNNSDYYSAMRELVVLKHEALLRGEVNGS